MRSHNAFTLTELLIVIAIVALLSALLLPAFWTTRGKARAASCSSNLHSIGEAFLLYAQDYDDRVPHAIDPVDRAVPQQWAAYPDFESEIPNLQQLHQVLQPYTRSAQLFACPADVGFLYSEFSSPVAVLHAFPSSYEKFGTSYYYHTELAAQQLSLSSILRPTQTMLLIDGAGNWHGTRIPEMKRYNNLFADGHVKNLDEENTVLSSGT